jgi:hypothetical protein
LVFSLILFVVILLFRRIKSLPFKRDGFWVASVRRMKPANRQKQWVGAWIEDGPEQEVFNQVVLLLLHIAKHNFFFLIHEMLLC